MSPLPLPSEVPDQAPHYVRAVTEMGELRATLATADIYAENGIKLVGRGTPVTGAIRDRLLLHKLRTPLDFSLSTENPVDAVQIMDDINQLLDEDFELAQMLQRSGDSLGIKHLVGALSLPGPLRFRFTVMRDRRPALFSHSLRVALITYCMAVRLGLDLNDKLALLLASLSHDLGEMHTDPAILAPGYRISAQERKFIEVHPVTGYVILGSMPGIPDTVLRVVLQHHERINGSGYPCGIGGDEMAPLARILSVAEVVGGIGKGASASRLEILLKLNHRRLDQTAVNALVQLLGEKKMRAGGTRDDRGALLRQLASVCGTLDYWQALAGKEIGPVLLKADLRFLASRMHLLRSLVLQAGIDPGNVANLAPILEEDDKLMLELKAALHELAWLMLDIANEIDRRAPTLSPAALESLRGLLPMLRNAPSR